MTNEPLTAVLRHIRRMAGEKAYKDASDAELVKRFLGGRDEAAFVVLLKRHASMVLNVCRRIQRNEHDAEDAFQATFLLFARKAVSIRKHQSVAGWLYRVAHRLAVDMKGSKSRRHAREKHAADVRTASSVPDKAWQELQVTLDEALRQVPEKYRAPLLLCYLEGKTQEQAAKQLDCPLGTVRSRLARGRDRLRVLLERQGLCLSANALVAGLLACSSLAAAPSTLVRATIKASLAYGTGQATTALVSARVAILVGKGLKTMTIAKLKTAMAVAILTSVLGVAAGAFVTQVPAGPSHVIALPTVAQTLNLGREPVQVVQLLRHDQKSPVDREAQPAKSDQEKMTLRGKVLDTAGKPAAGAKLLLVSSSDEPVDLGTTATDGQFKVKVPKEAEDRTHYLVARVEGAGVDFIQINDKIASAPIELRAEPDHPIQGRLVTTEGKPVAGAKVCLRMIAAHSGNSLESVLAEWRKDQRNAPNGLKSMYTSRSIVSTTTDPDGKFTLTGAGSDRLVQLHAWGDGIAESKLFVANRKGFDPKPYNQADGPNALFSSEGMALPPRRVGQAEDIDKSLLQGPNLTAVAEKERIFRGVVKDIDTGKPCIGVKVWLVVNYMVESTFPHVATTDTEGRYEIRGARKARQGDSYSLDVSDDTTTGYVGRQIDAENKAGYEPIIVDIGLKKGVIVTGKIIDAVTKKSLPGIVRASELFDNPFVNKYPSSTFSHVGTTRVAADGAFRLVSLPGPVVVMGGPDSDRWQEEQLRYKLAAPDPKYPDYFIISEGILGKRTPMFHGSGGNFHGLDYNNCKVLLLQPNVPVVTHDIIVEPAPALPVRIQDADGKPLAGSWVTGIGPIDFYEPVRFDTDSCSAFQLEPGNPRLMVFYEPAKNLVGTLRLKGDEKEPVTVRLGKSGTIKGRFLDEDGKPLAKVVVRLGFVERPAAEIHGRIHVASYVETDADGRFQFDKVIPGPEFRLWLTQGSRSFEPVIKMDPVSLNAGAVLDMAEIKLKLSREGD